MKVRRNSELSIFLSALLLQQIFIFIADYFSRFSRISSIRSMFRLQILQNDICPTYLNLSVMIDYFSKVQMIFLSKEPAIHIFNPT